jgi:CheY-like chemotaxis protein
MSTTARRLLIVDDDPFVANVYRSRFEKEGYETEVALDGQTAFYRLHEAQFDALLLDLSLPQMQGLEILRKIRAQKRFENFPVVVFTNAYLNQAANEASQAGANFVFSKRTATPRQIVEAINSFLVPGYTPSPAAPEAPWATTTPASPGNGRNHPETASRYSPPAPPPSAGPLPSPTPTAAAPNFAAPLPSAYRPPVHSPLPTTSLTSEAASENAVLRTFLATGPAVISAMQILHQTLAAAKDNQTQEQCLRELSLKLHSFTSIANLAGLQAIPQLGTVFEALLQEMIPSPVHRNVSTLQTVGQAVDLLRVLTEKGPAADPSDPPAFHILEVDDEVFSRRVVAAAMKRAKLYCVCVRDPHQALQLLEDNPFDLVITDIAMPGLNGFELLAKLRELPNHQHTPVMFVTRLTDFETRARSVFSGGADLIAKPIILIELAVKVLTFLIRAHCATRNR